MLLLSILFILVASSYPPNGSRILKREINVLTLHKGQYTTGRRSSPVPQLNCIGGSARSNSNKVEIVQCTNMGFDGENYNWKCESQLPDTLKLGKVEVTCEGFDYKGDPYVLVGSCGLEYELNYTDKYYEPKTTIPKTTVTETIHHVNSKPIFIEKHVHTDTESGFVVMVIIIIMVIFFVCTCAILNNNKPTMIRTTPNVILHETPTVVIRESYSSYPSTTVTQRTVHTESSTPSDNSKKMHTSTSYGKSNDR